MSDIKFYQEIKLLFEDYLSPKRDKLKIRIRDIEKSSILEDTDMNYSKVLFDSELNIYRLDKEQGRFIKLENDNFEAVVMRQE